MFEAIADQLVGCGINLNHIDLRPQCVNFIQKNPRFVDNQTHVSSFVHSVDRRETDWENY